MSKLFCALALILFAIIPASATVGDWQAGEHVRLRLLATHAPDGAIEGAIELELEPGWKTYWRSPGDAGIAPHFDFSASSGASDVTIDFPPPERFDDGFALSNVYHDRVMLPFRFAKTEASAPVWLELSADLGVCNEVCLPVTLRASVEVPPGMVDANTAAQIAEARAKLPGPGKPGAFEIVSLKRVGGPDEMPVFEATVLAGAANQAMLFAETPADWYPGTPMPEGMEGTTFRFDVDRKSATTPIKGAEIRLTLTGDGRATERRFHLDASGSAP